MNLQDITNLFSKKSGNQQREADMAGIFARPRAAEENPQETTKLSAATMGADVEFKGTLTFREKLLINGKFEGDISSEGGTLMIGRNAEIRAEIKVGNLISEGKIYGNTSVNDKVELRSPAQVFGDIQAARFSVEEGVVFVGNANITPGEVEQVAMDIPVQPQKRPYMPQDDILENQIKF